MVQAVGEAGHDAARAVAAARSAPGVATLIAPADIGWGRGGRVAAPLRAVPPYPVDPARINAAANALKAASRPALLLSGRTLLREPLELAGRIAAATGARLYCDFLAPRLQRGAGRVPVQRLSYFGEQVLQELQGTDLLLLIEADPLVAFFAYPGKPSELVPPGTLALQLARRTDDGVSALSALADLTGGSSNASPRQVLARPELPKGVLTPSSAGAVIAALLPENCIIVDESVTAGLALVPLLQGAAPHDWLAHSGGSLGMGLPLSTGASLACPDRKTICLVGDGSAMYTVQALWTQARERLDILTLVFSNRAYAILNYELQRLGAQAGPTSEALLGLARPELRFTELARGMGVEASRVETAEAFADELRSALARPGPRLIELVLG
jgi:acetolactate synthase-1/2/3 large subunit